MCIQTSELAYSWNKLHLGKANNQPTRKMPEIGRARKPVNWLECSPRLSLSKTHRRFLLSPRAVVYQRGSSCKEYEIRSEKSDPHEPHNTILDLIQRAKRRFIICDNMFTVTLTNNCKK